MRGFGHGDEEAVHNSYWDTESSSLGESEIGEGRNTEQMRQPTEPDTEIDGDMVYEGWDADIWDFGTDEDYPKLQWQE